MKGIFHRSERVMNPSALIIGPEIKNLLHISYPFTLRGIRFLGLHPPSMRGS